MLKPNSRRLRALFVSEETILMLFYRRQGSYLALPRYEGIPEDVRIFRVTHDQWRAGFLLLLEHESFSEVPQGEEIPLLPGTGVELQLEIFRITGRYAEEIEEPVIVDRSQD